MNEKEKNEILFWKVYKNKYIRNNIFENLKNMKLSFSCLEQFYLGNRVPFKLIRSLSWLSKRYEWSLLYDKLNNNEELLIKKSGIFRFLKNCKDENLIDLLYQKHTDEMNQVDLVLLAIQANNEIALEIFLLVYEIPTSKHSIDMSFEKGCKTVFGYTEKLIDFKYTTEYTRGLFKNLRENRFNSVEYILSKPDLFCITNEIIEIGTFISMDEKCRNLIINYEKFKLLKINGISTLEAIQSYLLPYYGYDSVEDRYQPFVLPDSIYRLLNKYYNHSDLFKLSIKYNILNGCYLLTSIYNFGKSKDTTELESYLSVAPIEFLNSIYKFKKLNIKFLSNYCIEKIIDLFKKYNLHDENIEFEMNDQDKKLCSCKEYKLVNGKSTIKFMEFEKELKLLSKRVLPAKPFEPKLFEFNSYAYRNDLNFILRKGELKDLIYLLNQGKNDNFKIIEPYMSKIIKYADLEIIKQLSYKFSSYGYTTNQISNSTFLKVIDRGRTDVYLYFLSQLTSQKNNDYKFNLDLIQISKLTFKGDIKMIKFLFQLEIDSNGINSDDIKIENNRRLILNSTFTNAIQTSNIKMVKWLLSNDNIFKHHINSSNIESLKNIELSFKPHYQNYFSIPFLNFCKQLN